MPCRTPSRRRRTDCPFLVDTTQAEADGRKEFRFTLNVPSTPEGPNVGNRQFQTTRWHAILANGDGRPIRDYDTLDRTGAAGWYTDSGDGLDDDCDGSNDCRDIDCSRDPICICDDDGLCEFGEDCDGCPGDCPGGTCGNGTCDVANGEDCVSCPTDCNGHQSAGGGGLLGQLAGSVLGGGTQRGGVPQQSPGMAGVLESFLDSDRDGAVVDDLFSMAQEFF
jgi:hypothetical protein